MRALMKVSEESLIRCESTLHIVDEECLSVWGAPVLKMTFGDLLHHVSHSTDNTNLHTLLKAPWQYAKRGPA